MSNANTKSAATINARWAHGLLNKNFGKSPSMEHMAVTAMRQIADFEEPLMPYTQAKSHLAKALKLEASTPKYQAHKSMAALVDLASKAAKAPKGKTTPKAVKGGKSRVQAKVTSFTNAEEAASAPITGDTGLAEQVTKLAQQVDILTKLMIANNS